MISATICEICNEKVTEENLQGHLRSKIHKDKISATNEERDRISILLVMIL